MNSRQQSNLYFALKVSSLALIVALYFVKEKTTIASDLKDKITPATTVAGNNTHEGLFLFATHK